MNNKTLLGIFVFIGTVVYFGFFYSAGGEPPVPQCESDYISSDLMLPESDLQNFILSTTASSIGKLPTLDFQTVETFEQYRSFADTMNGGIRIVNIELGPNIPLLVTTQEEYGKISKTITRYAPMINSYNNMVNAAQKVDISDQNSISCFYTRTAIFSVELTLISTSFSAGTSYKIVGEVYRASGLQSFAFKCPSCVSASLSNAHWFVRTHFVHTTSIVVIGVLEIINQSILELDKYEYDPKVIENFLKLPNNL